MERRRILLRIAIGLSSVAIVGLPFVVEAYRTRRPPDMRAENSVWVKTPPTFGLYQGWWLGCWIDTDQQSNRCRIYDPVVHPSIVYEARYVACEGESPIPLSQLKIKSPHDPRNMWLHPNGVAVVLQDGRLLVPAESYESCTKIRAGLEDRHELPAQAPQ
jgi:hypothetical protein